VAIFFNASAERWRYNGRMVTLNKNEERFVEALRALPSDVANQVILWATRLRDLADSGAIEWSPTWTEEDLADARRASVSRFEELDRMHS
jgi:tartrate dehydratase beta subunit/fumarate hydratase class I family protein